MKTIEEILQERLSNPVRSKDGTVLTNDQGEPILPLEAMVMSVMSNAMRGDIAAIAFIQNLTKTKPADDPQYAQAMREMLETDIKDIRSQLEADHLYEPSLDVEIERLANSLLIIQRLELKMREPAMRTSRWRRRAAVSRPPACHSSTTYATSSSSSGPTTSGSSA